MALRDLGSSIIKVLDGETRVAHGWGWLTLGAPAALGLYLFQLQQAQTSPPHHYRWVWPAIVLCIVMAAVGLCLLRRRFGNC